MNYKADSTQVAQIAKWLQTGSINIFGSPFAGKDTQGKRLADLLGTTLIGGGEILRKSTHEEVKKIIGTGELAPQKDYLEIMLPYLAQKEFAGKPLVLSSVGRWHGEESGVLDSAAAANHPLRAVIFLRLSEEEVRKRWTAAQVQKDRGQRADDSPEALEVRFEEFRTKTLPVIEFYRKKGLLIEIDGNAPRDVITAEILKSLAHRAQN